jgi:hypothetical protein
VAVDTDSTVAAPGTQAAAHCSIWVAAQESPTAVVQHFLDIQVTSLQIVVVQTERAHKLLVVAGILALDTTH